MHYHYPTKTWTNRRRLAEHQPNKNHYDFTNTYPDVRSLLLAIGLHGEGLVGIEVGMYRAESFCAILQCCRNVSKLYGVDMWEEYVDHIGGGAMKKDYKTAELNRLVAEHYIKHSGESERAEVLEMHCSDAAELFSDETFDFIFLDAYISEDDVVRDLEEWYPKLKKGGLFAGHDFHAKEVRGPVLQFYKKKSPNRSMVFYDSTWAWIK